MIHLIYISSATTWPSEEELTELLLKSEASNLKKNITGMLLYDNATYMQVLEGDESDVHELFDAICHDPRNNGVVKLAENKISERDFPDWSMGFKSLTHCSPEDLPGFVDIFNGKLDKEIAINNKLSAIKLLMNFVKNS